VSEDSDWLKWFSGKRVTVLGASGFIGRHLSARLVPLAREVVAFSRGTATPTLPALHGATIVAGDVTALDDVEAAIRGSDVVFVMAGVSGAAASWRDPQRSLDVNAGGLQTVLNAVVRSSPAATVVFPSSRLVYGAATSIPVAESAPLRPTSPYGLHKWFGEMLLDLYAQRHGLRYAIARLTNPYGALSGTQYRGYNVIASMIEAARANGELTVFGDGSQLRDYIHIDDAVDALLRVCVASRENVTVNIGSGVGTSFVEVVRTIVEAIGGGRLVFAPWPPEYAAVETGDFVADVARARALGIAQPRDLRRGLEQTISG